MARFMRKPLDLLIIIPILGLNVYIYLTQDVSIQNVVRLLVFSVTVLVVALRITRGFRPISKNLGEDKVLQEKFEGHESPIFVALWFGLSMLLVFFLSMQTLITDVLSALIAVAIGGFYFFESTIRARK